MIGIKRLDRYILGKFLLIFVGAFFICEFVLMMQVTWRYVDELIGKGLTLDILSQFYWYMGLTIVPQALPLATLLASLITFGNLGESFELIAIKAAGISLLRTMRPVAVVTLLVTGVSFFFQNKTSPDAQINLQTLLFSMKQQQPAVEIPEGVFYNGIPNINVFVQHKKAETGMLYQTIIYKTDQGFEKAQIVLADSARLEMSKDKMHLKLDLWNGEQFESLQSSGGTQMLSGGAEQPYDRETFRFKQLLIDFDSNFNMMDKEMLAGMAKAKNMKEIVHSVDSMNHHLDSVGRQYYADMSRGYYRRPAIKRRDSVKIVELGRQASPQPDFDRVLEETPAPKMQQAVQSAKSSIQALKADLEWKSLSTTDGDRNIRLHEREWHTKITLSLSCLLFFFIGAPLGAIIGKGGLGLPTVMSVAIYLIWYVIDTSSTKMARDGTVNMIVGMWTSTVVIAPFCYFFTSRANRDSVVFNMEANRILLFRLLGIRTKRHITGKEVIIEDPRLELLPEKIEELREACIRYNEEKQLHHAPSYVGVFFHYRPDREVERINAGMEAIIEELSNSRNPKVLAVLNEFPIVYETAHTSPFHSSRMNRFAGVCFPLGLVLWFRIWRFRLRLRRDMRIIVRSCDRLQTVLSGGSLAGGEGSAMDADEKATRRRGALKRRIIKWIVVVLLLALCGKIVWNGFHQYRQKARTHRQEQRMEERKQRGDATTSPMPSTSTLPAPASGPAASPSQGRTLTLPSAAPSAVRSK